jgi:hypothetical protein
MNDSYHARDAPEGFPFDSLCSTHLFECGEREARADNAVSSWRLP